MVTLLYANFERLWKDNIFRIGMVISMIAGLCCTTVGPWFMNMLFDISNGNISRPVNEGKWFLDYHIFTYVIIVAFMLSVVNSTYLGTEYSDGTLRNKIASGHSRKDIYLSNFITNSAAGCLLYLGYMIASLCSGMLYWKKFQYFERREVVVYMICIYAVMISLAAIFTMITSFVQNKTASVFICFGVTLAFFLTGNQQSGLLNQPEVLDNVTVNGIYYPPGSFNPYYIGGARRAISLFFYDFLPGGQVNQFFGLEYFEGNMNPLVMLSGSIILAAASIIVGVGVFQKKDLK